LRLEGESDDLPASLTPQKLVGFISEKIPDASEVFAKFLNICFQFFHDNT